MKPDQITVQVFVNVPASAAWDFWTAPEHIPGWAFASDDWEAPSAENDVRDGGKFKTVMRAKDGSSSFDFTGTYTKVVPHELIEYTMDDGRRVHVTFEEASGGTKVTETFDPENENSAEMQRFGWQAILDNFKKYAESKS